MKILKYFMIILLLLFVITSTGRTNPNAARGATFLKILSQSPESIYQTNTLLLHSNIETIGVVVRGDNLPKNAALLYRKSNDSNWLSGHPLMHIQDGSLVGSLFGLSPATLYYIKVVDGGTEIIDSIMTQPDEFQFTPEEIIYVDDDAAPGGDGSVEAPFQTIQEGIDNAIPGTRVLVADGIYHEGVSFNSSGSEDNWIQVMAEGAGAILDGADHLSGSIWKADPLVSNVWFTNIGINTYYLGRDGIRYYKYDNLASLKNGLGHNNVPMNEGWVVDIDGSTLYVRCLDDPATHNWQVTRLDRAFKIDNSDWVWIEGFEIQYFGGEFGSGVFLKDASNVIIRRNRFHNVPKGIHIKWTGGEDRSNNTRIEYNEISDPPVNEWPWNAVKGTSMEGFAINIRGHKGAIIRGNHLHHFFNGVYAGNFGDLENPGIAFDTDIYENNIHDISDDALEPEGASINQRFRNNTIDQTFVGISLSPITYGPIWVMRNLFSNYDATSIKWGLDSDGAVLIYHNTFWTDEENMNAMTIGIPVRNAVMRNNIFRGNRYAFESTITGSTGYDWNFDNWYTTRGPEYPHFKWENVPYYDIVTLCLATGLECNGHEGNPRLTDPENGNFTLLPTSPNINRGTLIPGINDDYISFAPDIGAYEASQLDFSFVFLPTLLKSK